MLLLRVPRGGGSRARGKNTIAAGRQSAEDTRESGTTYPGAARGFAACLAPWPRLLRITPPVVLWATVASPATSALLRFHTPLFFFRSSLSDKRRDFPIVIPRSMPLACSPGVTSSERFRTVLDLERLVCDRSLVRVRDREREQTSWPVNGARAAVLIASHGAQTNGEVDGGRP